MWSYGSKAIKKNSAYEVTTDFLRAINTRFDDKKYFETLLPFDRSESIKRGVKSDKSAPEFYTYIYIYIHIYTYIYIHIYVNHITYQRDTANAMLNQRALTDHY
jgi:hypothetical protein